MKRIPAFLLGLILSAPLALLAASVGGTTGGVQYVQGFAGMTPVQTTAASGSTADVNVKQVNGATVNVGTGAAGTGTQRVAVASDSAITANAGTNLNTSALTLNTTTDTTNTDLGPPGATACATDTGSCSLNALLQRIAQRITTLIGSTLATTEATLDSSLVSPGSAPTKLQGVICAGSKLNGSTSQQVKASAGALCGFFVNQSTACTIKLWDNTAASGTVLLNTVTIPTVGWYAAPFPFGTGLYITVGGTCDYTVAYN